MYYNKHRTDAACSNLPEYVGTSTPRGPRHMEGFHSRGQHLCKFIGTKKIFNIKKNSSTTTGMVWNTIMAAVTSCENALY